MLTSILIWACYTWAIAQFCKKHFGITAVRERIFILLLFIALLTMDTISTRYLIPYIVYALLVHAIIIGLVLLFFRAGFGKKILAASVVIAVITMIGDFCDSLLCFLTLYMLHTVKGIPEPFVTDWQGGLITCVHIAAVTLTINGISGQFESVFCGKTRQWYVTAALPLLVLTAIIDVANWGASHGIMVISRANMGLYYDQLFSHAEIGVLAALSAFAAGFYLFGMNKIYIEQQKSSQYQSQIAAYKMLEEQYRRLERLRHDMKNHIIALSGLLENKEYEKMGNYLINMEKNGRLENDMDITGSKAVDAILYQKRRYAEQNDILWKCDVQIPKTVLVSEFDLCVLFGNLLDNAVEACEKITDDKNRFIDIHAQTVKSCFLLEVRNSTDLEKTPGKYGIGLMNVNDAIQHYNGVMDIVATDGIFTASILIPIHNS